MNRVTVWLKSHTSLTIIIAAALLLEVISAVQYYYTRSMLATELENKAETELTLKAIIAKNTLNMTENSLQGHIWDMKRNLAYPDSMYSVAEWVMRSHPNLLGCGIAFSENFYPEKGRLYEPYVFNENGTLVRQQVAGPSHDYTQMPFYRVAKENNAPSWTYPYFDPVSSKNVVSYCRPIHNDKSETIAVFGLDIDLAWLGDTLNYRHVYPSSFVLLLTESGQLITGPSKDRVRQGDAEKIVSMINDSTVTKTLSYNGRSHYFNYRNAAGDKGRVFFAFFKGQPRWQIAVVCYDKEVYGKLKMMRLNIGVLMLLGLMVLALIISRFAKNSRKLQHTMLDKERLDSELRIARDIQMEMLPSAFPERSDLDVYGSLIPAREVGGDLFDYFLRNEKLFFCIGDVSGKGVPSAMVMAVIHSMFRMAVARENNPAHIMQTLNETSCQGNDSNMFVTLFIGVLDLPTGHLRYCNAGHDVPVVMGSEGPVMLPSKPNLPVGLFDDFKYEMQDTMLEGGSTFFLYTDGVTEAKNIKHQLFGKERMMAVLGKSMELGPRQLIEQMTNEVHAFVEDAEQSDDLTMLAFRYSPVAHQLLLDKELTLQNDVREVKTLNAFVKQVMAELDIEKSLAKKIQLAVEEAVVNVIDYAYPTGVIGEITLKVFADCQWMSFVIIDSGVAFDPTERKKADITLSAEDRPIGGLGILLLRELMDSINYERTGGKNILTLKKQINNLK